jgi:chromosome partitioning protein
MDEVSLRNRKNVPILPVMCDVSAYNSLNSKYSDEQMAQPPKTPPPPYFNINPEEAAKKLTDPISTARFAKAAAFA